MINDHRITSHHIASQAHPRGNPPVDRAAGLAYASIVFLFLSCDWKGLDLAKISLKVANGSSSLASGLRSWFLFLGLGDLGLNGHWATVALKNHDSRISNPDGDVETSRLLHLVTAISLAPT